MRLSANACASALLFTLPAVAQNALLYLATPSTADNPPTTLNPSEARLVIAQRLGLSRYHNLNQASDETLQVINSFSSTPDSLFSAHQEENSRQALVIIEGVEKPESFVDGFRASSLNLSPIPSSSMNAEFVSDLRNQYITEHGPNSLGGLIFHDTSLETAAAEYGTNDPHYRSQLDLTKKRLRHFTSAKDTDVILILAPHQASGTIKRSTASWGSYAKVKRQHIEATELTGTIGGLPNDIGLTPIEDEMNPALVTPPSRPAAIVPAPVQNAIGALQSNASTKPPRGILPYCYKSEELCKSATHNCSGHGQCVKKYTDETHGQTTETCFSCSCTATREERGKGMYKTTQWAGPACQKKDISTPFWLLGGTTVALVFAVGWGMSLLYAMGSEELPSVIGAGVSNAGARAK